MTSVPVVDACSSWYQGAAILGTLGLGLADHQRSAGRQRRYIVRRLRDCDNCFLGCLEPAPVRRNAIGHRAGWRFEVICCAAGAAFPALAGHAAAACADAEAAQLRKAHSQSLIGNHWIVQSVHMDAWLDGTA